MKTGLAIVSLRHMAHQAQDFALLVDDDRFVFLGSAGLILGLASANAPMAMTDAPVNFFLIRKVRNGLEGVFAGVENQHENAPGAAVHRS